MPSGEEVPSIIKFSDFIQVTHDSNAAVDPDLFEMSLNEASIVLPCQEM
jgi:hypothetical protein